MCHYWRCQGFLITCLPCMSMDWRHDEELKMLFVLQIMPFSLVLPICTWEIKPSTMILPQNGHYDLLSEYCDTESHNIHFPS